MQACKLFVVYPGKLFMKSNYIERCIIEMVTFYTLPKQIRKHNQLERVKAVSMSTILVEK